MENKGVAILPPEPDESSDREATVATPEQCLAGWAAGSTMAAPKEFSGKLGDEFPNIEAPSTFGDLKLHDYWGAGWGELAIVTYACTHADELSLSACLPFPGCVSVSCAAHAPVCPTLRVAGSLPL